MLSKFNPFVPNAPFLYPLKEVLWTNMWKGALGTNGLRDLIDSVDPEIILMISGGIEII